jgi:hypothetical protein
MGHRGKELRPHSPTLLFHVNHLGNVATHRNDLSPVVNESNFDLNVPSWVLGLKESHCLPFSLILLDFVDVLP